jgi:hypothetical protein
MGEGTEPPVADVDARLVFEPDPESDMADVDRFLRSLRYEIDLLDVKSVAPVPGGPAPRGTKSADPVTIGALLVAFSAAGGVLPALIETIRDWLNRHSGRSRVTLTIDGDTIELERASRPQQALLVDEFIRRHTTG